MKKLLAIFATTGMIATSGISVVACAINAKALDKEEILKVNPKNEAEIIVMLEKGVIFNERVEKLYVESDESENSELYDKVDWNDLSNLSEEEKNFLKNDDLFNEIQINHVIFNCISFKLIQFVLSLTETEKNEFIEENLELIQKNVDQYITNLPENIEEEISGFGDYLKSFIETGKDVINSNTIAVIKNAIEWLEDNKFD